MNLSQASKLFKISPKTQKALTVWEMANLMTDLPHEVKVAAQGIAYAAHTGRLNGTAAMGLRRASSYEQLRILVSVVNAGLSQAEVAGFLNRTLTN